MFATIFIAILDLSTGECQYTSAGHHSSYLKKENGKLLTLNQIHGPVAGALENAKFSKDKLSIQKGILLWPIQMALQKPQTIKIIFTEKSGLKLC